MTQKGLSVQQVADYERDGYLAPIEVYSEKEMAEFRRRLEEFQARYPEGTKKIDLKAHLVCPWLEEMVHNPKFLDVVESLYQTSDILCTTSSFRFKKPNSPTYAAWHQDEISQLVWAHPSIRHSHYKNPQGKVYTLSPWAVDHYWALTKDLDPDAYELR